MNHRIVERTLRSGGSPSGHVRLRAVNFCRSRESTGSPRGYCRSSAAGLARWKATCSGARRITNCSFHCGLRSSEIHPLNLSISISGGRETNRDSPSNGERSGNTSVPRSEISGRTHCTAGELWSGEPGCPGVAFPGPEVDLERRAQEGESPVGPGNRERRDESSRSSSRVVWECSSNRVVDSIQG